MAAFAARSGYEVAGVFREAGSGARTDRVERRKVLALPQRRGIDAVLVTELSRWGRGALDLLHTLQELEVQHVSVIAMSGAAFDLPTPHGRMLATVIAGIAEFERELIRERVRSGMAAAKARGGSAAKPGPRLARRERWIPVRRRGWGDLDAWRSAEASCPMHAGWRTGAGRQPLERRSAAA